jgi:hypothetical protein
MNRLLAVILVAFSFQTFAQEKVVLEKPTVDKRVELLSIVFRLAEKQEYSNERFKVYADRIDQYFEKHKNHELIQFTKSIISKNAISFDGPMWLAVHLDDNLSLLTDVKDVWQHDPRWTKENVEKFVPLLQKFHKETNFDEFFKINADLYDETLRRFTPIYEKVNLNWFSSFFGKEYSGKFWIKVGLGVEGNCYGVNLDYINGNRNIYAIAGLWFFDNAGYPVFLMTHDFPILIHEFSHPFVDKLTEKNREMFRESGQKIYSGLLTESYTSWEVLLDEALINASVVMYMKNNDFKQSEIDGWVKMIKGLFGTFWIEELVEELGNYEKQRDQYPTLDSYMPQLSEAYKIWTKNIRTNEE